MLLNFRTAIGLAVLFVSSCGVDDKFVTVIQKVLPTAFEPKIDASCSSFLGLGPTVAVFEFTSTAAGVDEHLIVELANRARWSFHETMSDFVDEISLATPGITATLLDGKECLRSLTADADTILFGHSPGAYYASLDERVVIVVRDNAEKVGLVFVQAP